MEFLATHFKHFLSVESGDILNEWELLKVLIYERFGDALETQTWKSIQQKLSGDGLENVFLLIDMIRTLPPTSVKNETTFSAMKLTKGKRRGRMKNSTLNDLLTVQIQSSNVENFDPDESIQCWMKTPSGRKRRIVPKIKNPAEQRNQRHILQPVVADVVPNEVHVDEVLADHSDEAHIEEAAAFAEQHGLIPDHGDAGVVTPSINPGEEDESDDEELEEEYDFEDSEESDNEMTELEVERELELL